MLPRRHLGANPLLLCAFQALLMCLFPMAVITLIWTQQLGLDISQIMLLQAFFGLVVVLLEFPSGYLADRIGYRRALVLGASIAVTGWCAYTAAESLAGAVVAEALLGVGLSLISGADTALLYESLLETGRQAEFTRWYGRLRFAGQAAEGSGALAAGVLFAVSPRLPFALQIVVLALAAVVALRLVEPVRHRPPVGNHLRHAAQIVRHLGRARRLRWVVFLSITFALSSFIPVWLIALYARDAGVPVAWLGPIWAAANYAVAVSSLASDRLGRRFGMPSVLLACVGLVGGGYLGLGLSHHVLGFGFYFLLMIARGVHGTLLHHEEQQLIPSRDRASFISLRSLLFRGSFLALGPLVGAAVDAHGQHPVLLAAGVAFFGATLLGWVQLARAPRTEDANGPA